MSNLKNVQKSSSGIYYLRVQRGGLDRKISLQTRDIHEATIAAAIAHATLSRMTIDHDKIKSWTLKTDGENIEITTENNDADRASAKDAFVAFVQAKRTSLADGLHAKIQQEQPKATMPFVAALAEYKSFLATSKIAVKSQRMAMSTLSSLIGILGSQFDMAQINDDVIEEKWLKLRLTQVAETTAKRDLSFIRSFVEWSADKKRKYCLAALTLSIEAEGESWSYLNSTDLKLIFDNLHTHAENAWQLWIPIISLYSGARVAEITSIKTEYVYQKSGIHALRLAGTKTDASDRDIPIHADILQLGFLDYVAARRKSKQEYLFDVRHHNQNGAGATVSKWYTSFKNTIGLKDKLKVFHSFRPTIVDHLKQAGAGFEARCQYVGHDAGGGVHNKIYGRNELNLTVIQAEVVDKIDWLKYCGWQPDLILLKAKADTFI